MPAAPAGEVAVICVALSIVKPVALVAPNLTAVTLVKLVPVMVTEVPPAVGPAVGETLVTVGEVGVTVIVKKPVAVQTPPLSVMKNVAVSVPLKEGLGGV